MKKILVIIPAYNEEKSIERVVKGVREAAERYDILVVNDCSTDGTEGLLKTLGVSHVTLSINLGIGGAMQTGYMYAKERGYDFAVQVDGDGQHEVGEIKKLIVAQEKSGANLVIGSRFLNEKSFRSTFMRRVGIKIFALITRVLVGQRISDATSGFRLADRGVIGLYSEYYPSDYPEPEVIIYLKNRGMKIVETAVKMNERQGGKSSITSLKSIYFMVKVIGSMLIQKLRG